MGCFDLCGLGLWFVALWCWLGLCLLVTCLWFTGSIVLMLLVLTCVCFAGGFVDLL